MIVGVFVGVRCWLPVGEGVFVGDKVGEGSRVGRTVKVELGVVLLVGAGELVELSDGDGIGATEVMARDEHALSRYKPIQPITRRHMMNFRMKIIFPSPVGTVTAWQ